MSKIARYNVEFSFLPKDITGTYWMWNNYVTGTSKTYSINVELRDPGDISQTNSLYIPFKQSSYTGTETSDTIYYYTSGKYPIYKDNADEIAFYANIYIGYLKNQEAWGGYYSVTGFTTDYTSRYEKYFKITGGSDVTNSTLISLLVQNATQCDSRWNPLQ